MHSKSLGTGRVSDGTLTLRPNASSEDHEQFQSHSWDGREQRANANCGGRTSQSGDDVKPPTPQSIIGYEQPIMLTQSTHSFLFTEPTCSLPFWFALVVIAISYICLLLALFNNLFDDYSPGNLLGVPVNVSYDVKIAQYLALLIGLIMEEEIPESLFLLRMITEKTLHKREPNVKFGKFVFCAILRIVMGYLFYTNMFVVVVQAERVVDIFFDVLALQFLQQVDDICFRLAKMDVFGKRMKVASTRKCFRSEFEKLPFARRKKMSVFVKALYFVNLCALMAGMTVITMDQSKGHYQCHSITVTFGDEIWQNSIALNATGGIDRMDLIYSYFNGVYVKNGTFDGRPLYTEQNKYDGTQFKVKTGAMIKYCESERAWVFMHPNIRKDLHTTNSDCPWLLKSETTDSYNLLEVANSWSIWTGIINKGSTLQTSCNSCDGDADCNYHGTCTEGFCECYTEDIAGLTVSRYTGTHCEFSRPCSQVTGNEGDVWDIRMMLSSGRSPWMAYGRGVYFHEYGGNITSAGQDDTLILLYTGSRWFAAVYENTSEKSDEYWTQYAKEIHGFWDRVYKENTHAVSDPTRRSDPIAVDFFRIGQRGEKYGPLGELLPAQSPPGSGYFECSFNYSSLR